MQSSRYYLTNNRQFAVVYVLLNFVDSEGPASKTPHVRFTAEID